MKREIVCLIGSTRFKSSYIEANFRETMAGRIVLTCGWFSHTDGEVYTPTEEEKKYLDELHLDKIDMADQVLVITPPQEPLRSYIGASTSRELKHSRDAGKKIRWWSFPNQMALEGETA